MTRKNNSKILSVFLLLLIVSLLLISLSSIKLVKTSERDDFNSLSRSQREKVNEETRGMDIEQIIDYSLSFTARELRFAVLNDIPEGKANCVGYAQLCAAICNQAMVTNRISGQAKPVVGYLESNGINWCKVLRAIAPKDSYRNFVKDHDFVELNTPSKRYYFDPSIYDVLGNKCFTQTNKNADNNG